MVPVGSFLRWLSSTAGYVPGNEARISPSDFAHHQRVLSSGCYPFLSGRLENLSIFLASLSASTKGVIATANRSAFTLSQSLTTPFAVPLLVSKTVTFVTLMLIQKGKIESNFSRSFVCFIFQKRVGVLLTMKIPFGFQRNLARKTKSASGKRFFQKLFRMIFLQERVLNKPG